MICYIYTQICARSEPQFCFFLCKMMAERLRGHERRFSDIGACSHPLAESLIGRLDELDIRLRQLEEKQSFPKSYFAADLRRNNGHHHQCKSLSSALQDVRLKGNLMDRIHSLETRLLELNSELDKSDSNNAGSSPTHTKPLEMNKKHKTKESKESMKRTSAMYRNEKRKMKHNRIYRRWFPVAC